jgi:hypothetical protein
VLEKVRKNLEKVRKNLEREIEYWRKNFEKRKNI